MAQNIFWYRCTFDSSPNISRKVVWKIVDFILMNKSLDKKTYNTGLNENGVLQSKEFTGTSKPRARFDDAPSAYFFEEGTFTFLSLLFTSNIGR
ncbi:hypothetical protein NQ317_003465 [Molorchus minor]|uniref:Uncharacterized protein n=1 Tax=Molorchus minor TaxID=1323400 RepID=A0ABQ9K270_9CUCU|nr:hypothetical protein NQ317_003465 [Molorchus minor]